MAKADEITLSMDDIRAVAGFSAGCAQQVLAIFTQARPEDTRPREAIDAALAFASGGKRLKALRDTAWAAQKAARAAGVSAAEDAAMAAMCAASAAYLHPLADAHQVKHILGAAAHAARAVERNAGDNRSAGSKHAEAMAGQATNELVSVLKRYPSAPDGGGRIGELIRLMDARLRGD